MSVLKVGALRSPSASSNNIVLNADGTISSGDGGAIPSNTYITGTFVSNNYYEAFKLQGPTITSIHPSANVAPGDTVYIVGTGFDRSANVMLVSNTNVDVVVPRGNITFNNSSNVTFVVPGGYEQPRYTDEDYDVRITIDNTGLAAVQLDALDFTNPSIFQGSYLGYTSGGATTGPTPEVDIIDKFTFATDTNATDVGDLSLARRNVSGQSSTVSGYTSGGQEPVAVFSNVIDKFPFTTDANATDVGDLYDPSIGSAGQSSSVSGYASGGNGADLTIQKFPFSTDSNSTDVGDLSVNHRDAAGQSSSVSGYTSGGIPTPTMNTIDKFPFATDANATDVGDLTVGRTDAAGQSSSVSGYTSGGGPAITDTIDKFPFATDANATDVGNLTISRTQLTGQSSTRSGYTSGGSLPANSDTIDKFPFATDANATDVGDLTVGRYHAAGQQI